ncbi:hypothetical protein [Dankookia sp. P2]|uniref:hypothetical protein n=1 Tax=Dankookia sp. P2 TaxID=3423955 RepID=UPI003D66A209
MPRSPRRSARLHAAFQRIAGQEADEGEPLTLFAYDRDARMLVGSTLHPVPRDQDFADRDYTQTLRDPQAPEPQIGGVLVGRLNGRAFFTLSRRRESANPPRHGGYDGVVVASVYVEGANRTLQRLLREPEDVLSLVRADGEVLARSAGLGPNGPPLRVAPGSMPLAIMTRGEERSIIYGRSSLDGVARLAVYRRVEGWPVSCRRGPARIRGARHLVERHRRGAGGGAAGLGPAGRSGRRGLGAGSGRWGTRMRRSSAGSPPAPKSWPRARRSSASRRRRRGSASGTGPPRPG